MVSSGKLNSERSKGADFIASRVGYITVIPAGKGEQAYLEHVWLTAKCGTKRFPAFPEYAHFITAYRGMDYNAARSIFSKYSCKCVQICTIDERPLLPVFPGQSELCAVD